MWWSALVPGIVWLAALASGCARSATRPPSAPPPLAHAGAPVGEPSRGRATAGALAPSAAEAASLFARIEEPTGGLRADGRPRGVMIVIHGGGWQSRGERSVEEPRNRAEVDRWRARGWRTVAVSFRSSREGPPEVWPYYPIGQVLSVEPGSARASIDDVVRHYDRVHAGEGRDLPICATGWSSGGHLALLLAAERPELDCVVALAAPTDLPALFAAWTDGARAAAFAFGPEGASTPGNGLSPVDVAGRMRARILLATAANDGWIPASQMAAMRDAIDRTGSPASIETIELEPGRTLFWHGHVSPAALDRLHAAEDALAAAVER